MFDVVAELPMLALILHLEATPMHIGSSELMVDVGGNDHPSARDFGADQFGGQVLALGDVLHLVGDDALARIVHLRPDRIILGAAPPILFACPNYHTGTGGVIPQFWISGTPSTLVPAGGFSTAWTSALVSCSRVTRPRRRAPSRELGQRSASRYKRNERQRPAMSGTKHIPWAHHRCRQTRLSNDALAFAPDFNVSTHHRRGLRDAQENEVTHLRPLRPPATERVKRR